MRDDGQERSVRVRRIYEDPEPTDGARVLVDRLWPRGISKERAALTEWLKDVAPSAELRKWYSHDPALFGEFRDRYLEELSDPEQSRRVEHLRSLSSDGGLTLLTATKQPDISEAAVLADLLTEP